MTVPATPPSKRSHKKGQGKFVVNRLPDKQKACLTNWFLSPTIQDRIQATQPYYEDVAEWANKDPALKPYFADEGYKVTPGNIKGLNDDWKKWTPPKGPKPYIDNQHVVDGLQQIRDEIAVLRAELAEVRTIFTQYRDQVTKDETILASKVAGLQLKITELEAMLETLMSNANDTCTPTLPHHTHSVDNEVGLQQSGEVA